MDPDDALIDLLNGFGPQRGFNGTGNSEKPFLDASGVPTDSFLQALKHDFTSFSLVGDHRPNQNGRRDARRQFKPEVTDMNNRDSDSSEAHSSSENDEDDIRNNSSSDSDEENSDGASSSTFRDSRDQRRYRGTQSQSVRNNEFVNGSEGHSLQQKDAAKSSRTPHATSHRSYSTVGRAGNGHEGRSVPKRPLKRKEKANKLQHLPANLSDCMRTTDGLQAPLNRNASFYQRNLFVDGSTPASTGRGNILANSASAHGDLGDDLDLKVESDLKIKSLQLRITGQLQTIRVLETQLGDTQRSLEMRSQLVKQMEGRLKQLEPKDKGTLSTKTKAKEELKQLSAKADERVERYKVCTSSARIYSAIYHCNATLFFLCSTFYVDCFCFATLYLPILLHSLRWSYYRRSLLRSRAEDRDPKSAAEL